MRDKETKVKLNYLKFPEVIESGVIRLNEDQSIKISTTDDDTRGINIEVRDNTFGASYLNSFVLDYDTAKDFYNILYQILKQIYEKL